MRVRGCRVPCWKLGLVDRSVVVCGRVWIYGFLGCLILTPFIYHDDLRQWAVWISCG